MLNSRTMYVTQTLNIYTVSQKTETPLKVIVSRIQAHKIKRIFYQKILSQFYVKDEILKKNRCIVAEICPFKHKHPQT